jgi:hypothetical protein
METMEDYWSGVETYIQDAKCIAFDGCHKIYLAMDHEQADWFRTNYEHSMTSHPDEMLRVLRAWYDKSCLLRFIQAVETNEVDPNEGYTTLIPQGAEFDLGRTEEEEVE